MSDSCTVTPPPAFDKSTQENDLHLGGSLVFSDWLQNRKGIFFVSVYYCEFWQSVSFLGYYNFTAFFCILDDSFFIVLWEEVSFYSPSNFVGLIERTYFSRGKLGMLQYCLSVQPDMHSCQNSFWGSYLNWFGDTLSILWMTLLVLIVHLAALFLFITIEAPKKIMDLVHKALCEFVVLLALESLGPY